MCNILITNSFNISQIASTYYTSAAVHTTRPPRMAPLLEAPSAFCCPITLQPMEDPVVLRQTGQSYERRAIEQHLRRFSTCPCTLLRLDKDKTFVQNHQLRKAIQEFHETQLHTANIQSALRISLVALLQCSIRHREFGSFEEVKRGRAQSTPEFVLRLFLLLLTTERISGHRQV